MANESRFFGGNQRKNDPGSNSDNDDSIIEERHDGVVVDVPGANKNDADHAPHMETDPTGWRSMNQQVLDVGNEKEDGRQMKDTHRIVILEEELDAEAVDYRSAATHFTSTEAPCDGQQKDAKKRENIGGTKSFVNSDDQEVIVIDDDSDGVWDMGDCQSCDDQQETLSREHLNRNPELTISIEGTGEESSSQGEITQKKNPFAQFAFGSTSNTAAAAIPRGRNWVVSKQLEPKPKKVKTKKGQKSEWKPMADLSASEQERVRQKWHGLVVMPCDSSLEDARFQIMVASRLHARCQEAVVRKCMASLHNAGVLTCRALADYDVDALASLLTSLQYYNTKSKHLVQASKELLHRFDGKVPESKDDLLTITGIGPVMADLLSTINSRAAHQARAERSSNTSTLTTHHTAFVE